jgi:hypothetical protein
MGASGQRKRIKLYRMTKEELPMAVNINIRVTPFGQVIFELGKPAFPSEESKVTTVQEEPRYREPQETAYFIYELRYEEEAKNYIVPPVTG